MTHHNQHKNIVRRLARRQRHPLLKKALEALPSLFSNPKRYPFLEFVLANGEERSRRKNGSYRAVRSDRLDPIIGLLAFYISEYDLMSFRVGITPYHNQKKILAPTLKDAAEATGFSESALRSARSHLENAGLITHTPQRFKQSDGSYKSAGGVVKIKTFLFALLGVRSDTLQAARAYAKTKWLRGRAKRFPALVGKEQRIAHALSQAKKSFALTRSSGPQVLTQIIEALQPPARKTEPI